MAVDPTELRPPDAGAAWLDLLSTVGSAYGSTPVERLTDPSRLTAWLSRAGLAPSTPAGQDDLVHARRLREVLRPLGLGAAARRAPDPDAVAALDAEVAAAAPLRVEVRDGRVAVTPPATAADALARVAREAAGHLAGPEADQLRTCDDPVCAMLFLDPSGRRRWCSARTCGVRHRVRAHRARASQDARSGAAGDTYAGGR